MPTDVADDPLEPTDPEPAILNRDSVNAIGGLIGLVFDLAEADVHGLILLS
jgi:hypothetical protein